MRHTHVVQWRDAAGVRPLARSPISSTPSLKISARSITTRLSPRCEHIHDLLNELTLALATSDLVRGDVLGHLIHSCPGQAIGLSVQLSSTKDLTLLPSVLLLPSATSLRKTVAINNLGKSAPGGSARDTRR